MSTNVTEFPARREKLPLVPCLPLTSAQQLLSDPENQPFHRFLLPFDEQALAASEVEEILAIAGAVDGELILLRVGYEDGLDEEGMFTRLRALQARAQQRLGMVRVDSLVSDTAVSLLTYAHQHQVDLIILPRDSVCA